MKLQLLKNLQIRFLWLFLSSPAITLIAADRNPSTNADINSVISYSSRKGWLNDPNGLIFVDGLYHLFYQHNSNSNYPQHICWGHAVSSDLVDWQEKAIAINYNASRNEEIFSGNAVIDKTNASGFGKDSSPLIAFWTSRFYDAAVLPDGWSAPQWTQVQSLSYSEDRGQSWIKYSGNPIIRQPPTKYSDQITSFRDPNVFWYQPHGKWVMTLVLGTSHKAVWYSSQNLIDWTYTGEFGWRHSPEGEWECPALVEFWVGNTGERKWVLILSTGDGAIAGGSGMHYHIGHFDGFAFHKEDAQKSTVDWFDYGADCYAGVLWGNVPNNRMIMSIWNNNWAYCNKLGETYKGAISSRELTLAKVDGEYKLLQAPIWQLSKYVKKESKLVGFQLKMGMTMFRNETYRIKLLIKGANQSDFSFVIEEVKKRRMMAKFYYFYERHVFCFERPNPDPDQGGQHENHCVDLTAGNEFNIEILIDNYVCILFLKGGEYTFTEVLHPYFKIRKLRLLSGYPKIAAEAILTVLSKNL